MASEDLFEEEFSEEIIAELERDNAEENLEADVIAEIEELNSEDVEAAPANEEQTETNPATEATSENKTTEKDKEAKLFQLPLARIRALMKLDPDMNLASHEAVFLVARATEIFIESLARESYTYTNQAKKKTVQKRDVELAIAAVDSLMFLEGAMN